MGTSVTEKPVRLSVRFNRPENTVITLQGKTLDAYRIWQEDGDEVAEEFLANMIMEQCEDHVALWTTLDEWDIVR